MPDLKEFAGELGKDKLAVLHKLDAQAGKWYLPAEHFKANLKDWEIIPVIFAKEHPKVNARENLKKALENCNGKLMGFPSGVRIETTGHPKLLGNLPINDAFVEELYNKGRLGVSPCWDSPDDGHMVTGAVVPDHILLFEETAEHRPGDKAAMMFQEPVPEYMNEFKAFMQKVWDRITKDDPKEVKTVDEAQFKAFKDEMEKKMADQTKAFEDEKKKLAAELEAKDKAVKEFVAKQEQEKKDNTWKTFKATGKVPKAWLTGKAKVGDKEMDKEAITRKEFEDDPAGFAVKVLKFFDENNSDVGQNVDGRDGTDGAGEASRAADLPEVKTIGNPQDWDEAKGCYK